MVTISDTPHRRPENHPLTGGGCVGVVDTPGLPPSIFASLILLSSYVWLDMIGFVVLSLFYH